ncbi:MAG TPA: glycosyltransferase family 4 protein [Gemmatimonadaceae bacterium]
MRVLIVTDWNRGQGGAEAYLGWLRSGLIASGDKVRLMTSSAGTMGDGTAEYVAYGTERVAVQAFLQIVNPFAVRRIRRALTEFRPSVVLVNMFAQHLSPAILHALGAVPTILAVSDYKCICPMGSKLRPDNSLCGSRPGWTCHTAGCVSLPHWIRDQPRYALLRSGVAKVDAVVACSNWVQRALESEGIQSEHIQLPVPTPGVTYRRNPSADPTFLFCGRLDVEKGVEYLVRAFTEVRRTAPRAQLRIAGRGPELDRLVALAGELDVGDAVSFLGWLLPNDIEAELSRAWVLVAPSLWAEPLGLVALEAIVRGVPVIATSTGGFAETVEESVSGFLVPNGDVGALAERMAAIAEGREFPEHRVADDVIARIAERHSIRHHVDRMRDVFRRTISGTEVSSTAANGQSPDE